MRKKELKESCFFWYEKYEEIYFKYSIEKHENDKLRQENKQLQDRIKKYENPEDLTLMFMYCDEKAKDKIKELQERINKAIEYIKHSNLLRQDQIYDNSCDMQGWEVKELLEILRGEENAKN
jgi:hypothetical protein